MFGVTKLMINTALRGKCQTDEEAEPTWISRKRALPSKIGPTLLKRKARQEGEMGYKSFKTTMPS